MIFGELGIKGLLRRFEDLPMFEDGRIDYSNAEKAAAEELGEYELVPGTEENLKRLFERIDLV